MKKILLTLACSFLLTACLASEPVENSNNGSNENTVVDNNDSNDQSSVNQNSDSGSNNSNANDNGDDVDATNENNQSEENNQGSENNNEDNGSTQGDEGGQEDNGNQSGESNNQQSTEGEEKTKTVSFYNGGFTNSSLNQVASQQNFVKWFNGDDDLLESITYSGYSQLNYIGNEKDSWRFSTLILGSSNNDGYIKFNFAHDVKSVKFNIQGYCKYIEYSQSYSVDTSSKFLLDDDVYDLSVSPSFTGELEKRDVSKDYNPLSKSITIQSEDGRVFVHSMEITYIK